MSVDRDMAIRATVHQAVDASIDVTRRLVDDCALPRPEDVRRLLALQQAVGDIAAGLSRGETDLSREWLVVAALAVDAVEGSLAEAAARPITPEDFRR